MGPVGVRAPPGISNIKTRKRRMIKEGERLVRVRIGSIKDSGLSRTTQGLDKSYCEKSIQEETAAPSGEKGCFLFHIICYEVKGPCAHEGTCVGLLDKNGGQMRDPEREKVGEGEEYVLIHVSNREG